ncbi:protein P' [Coastal Plains virus]|uniref:Protein P' n=1 Tax=Coastal Plains virus TaxID=764599 RepID=D8V081_9RHAB|nr:protein P' [Coastal Plains virus]ADG86358.1 protein P' [Coastal Plains virus]
MEHRRWIYKLKICIYLRCLTIIRTMNILLLNYL